MKKFQIVEIDWIDATSGNEDWIEIGELSKRKPKGKRSQTVGYLVSESNDAVMVAAIVNTDHVGTTTIIPRGMIKTVRVLK